jgi:hypothetical protein
MSPHPVEPVPCDSKGEKDKERVAAFVVGRIKGQVIYSYILLSFIIIR